MAESYFKRAVKGYDMTQVDAFIIQMSDKYAEKERGLSEKLRASETECEKLKSRISALCTEMKELELRHGEELAHKKTEVEALCAEVGEKLIVADRRAESIVASAEKEAALLLAKAKSDAENEAKAIINKANDIADARITETEQSCNALLASAAEFKRRQTEINETIAETEKRFGDALLKLRGDLPDKK